MTTAKKIHDRSESNFSIAATPLKLRSNSTLSQTASGIQLEAPTYDSRNPYRANNSTTHRMGSISALNDLSMDMPMIS